MNEKTIEKSLKYREVHARTGWVGAHETVTIAGREIGGMIYVGTPPKIHDYYKTISAHYIDPALPVLEKKTTKSEFGLNTKIPSRMNYTTMSKASRAGYLDWLANGRSEKNYELRYVLLYFYGLERRIFYDQVFEEAHEIIAEVRRLSNVLSRDYSLKNALHEVYFAIQMKINVFMEYAQFTIINYKEIQPTYQKSKPPAFSINNSSYYYSRTLPLKLEYALSARITQEGRLNDEWILSWFMSTYYNILQTPAQRCYTEFLELFKILFNARYPHGLEVAVPQSKLWVHYFSASQEFSKQFYLTVNGKKIPSIDRLRKPMEIAHDIANEAMDILSAYSRFIGANPEKGNSIHAYTLLPHELRGMFHCEELDTLSDWVNTLNTRTVIARELINKIEESDSDTVTNRQLRMAVNALEAIGFGFEPDPRFFALKSDATLQLFRLGNDFKHTKELSSVYEITQLKLLLGLYFFHLYGSNISTNEINFLKETINNAQLEGTYERNRLHASFSWMQTSLPNIRFIRKRLNLLHSKDHSAYRAFIIDAARVEGLVHPKKIAAVEKLYKAVGWEMVYSDLHAGESSDLPVTVREFSASVEGEPITSTKRLDKKRIAKIQTDTHRISSVLGDIFEEETDNFQRSNKHTKNTHVDVLHGLDNKHAHLLKELMSKNRWSVEEFENLCAQTGLFAEGAVEEINEWVYEHYDEVLVEEHNGYEISHRIAETLKGNLKD